MPSNPPVVEVRNLEKRFGDTVALSDVSLDVRRGEVLGLLGPNGAGKTTTVRVLATLLVPDGGTAMVAGADVVADPKLVRSRIGLTGQYAAIDEKLTGRENLVMVGRLLGWRTAEAGARADELLERFSLTDAANRQVSTYSGGMRRRADIAISLVGRPEVLFLDEPTTGLDPVSRFELWDIISELVADGTTLLLTTQYLEEADRLADRIVVIDRGTVIAQGTPTELKDSLGGQELVVRIEDPARLVDAAAAVTERGFEPRIDEASHSVTASVGEDAAAAAEVISVLSTTGVHILDFRLQRPSLDDVFVALTGRERIPEGAAE